MEYNGKTCSLQCSFDGLRRHESTAVDAHNKRSLIRDYNQNRKGEKPCRSKDFNFVDALESIIWLLLVVDHAPFDVCSISCCLLMTRGVFSVK